MVKEPLWKEGWTQRAKGYWDEYQQTHDVSGLKGKTAGIDPETGRIWIGEDIHDVAEQRAALGLDSPLFFERIGFMTYYRKGGRH